MSVAAPSLRRSRILRSARARDIAVLAGVAFILRVAWVLVYGRVDPPVGALNDTVFYEFASVGLATNGTYANLDFQPTARWPPGFPFVVSLLYRIFGVHLKLALALNVVLATATVALLYLIADRMFGRTGARIAAGAFAILPGPLYFTGLYLSETLFIFMLVGCLALVVFLPDRRWAPLVVGVAIGLTALTRGEGLLIPIIPLAVWWTHLARREWLLRAGVLIAAMVLTIAPWTIRNAIVMDAFVPVANNASWTLHSGHNPYANGAGGSGPLRAAPLDTRGEDKSESENAQELRRKAIRWALRNPHKELGLIPRKLLSLNGASSGSISWLNAGKPYQRQLGRSSVLVFTILADAFGYFLLLVTLASLLLFGARSLWRTHPGMRGVLAYLALCLVNFGFVYYGQYRYRIPMEPFMILVATPLLVGIWSARDSLRRGVARLNAGDEL
jgi:4-amino-4-deoxy-L-arabinose transferase-like glycosyltransferase